MVVDSGGRRVKGEVKVESSIKAAYTEPLEAIVERNSTTEEASKGGGKSLGHDMRERSNDVVGKEEKRRKKGTKIHMTSFLMLIIDAKEQLAVCIDMLGNKISALQHTTRSVS
ncbi:hypothetical protein M0804_003046 [Polistes exclamans]|nr:hypothetical protein M0804_003046 [Polistes exclamans]